MPEQNKMVTLVNRRGEVIGHAPELEVHMPGQRRKHRGLQVLVWSPDRKELIIRYRSNGEDAEKWANAVITHISQCENFFSAAIRELQTGLGIVLTQAQAIARLRPLFVKEPVLGTKMHLLEVYSFVLYSGEIIVSKDMLKSITFDGVRSMMYGTPDISPQFRLVINDFRRKFVSGPLWRNRL